MQTSRRRVAATELTLLFKGKILCEMSALVVASEEEERVGVVDLQGPQVQHTLVEKHQSQPTLRKTLKQHLI